MGQYPVGLSLLLDPFPPLLLPRHPSSRPLERPPLPHPTAPPLAQSQTPILSPLLRQRHLEHPLRLPPRRARTPPHLRTKSQHRPLLLRIFWPHPRPPLHLEKQNPRVLHQLCHSTARPAPQVGHPLPRRPPRPAESLCDLLQPRLHRRLARRQGFLPPRKRAVDY